MMRKFIKALLLSLVLLVYTPVQGEMTISGSSNLDTLDYDLDNIHLKLEKLESRWQLSPITGKLFVEKLRAKRLLITMRGDAKKSGDSTLPERIKLPFPIQIQQAEVLEVVVVTPTESHTLNNVQFDLDADIKTIQLNYLRAGTPFGQAEISLNMETANPFALTGAVSIKQSSKEGALTSNTPYDVKTNLSGNLKALKFESDAMLVLQDNQIALMQTDVKSNAAARIHASGEIGLLNAYPLTAHVKISDVHPERLGAYPVGLLNVDLNVEGNLASQAGLENGLNLSC
jgi:translocation and assembly module TamB